MGHALNIPSTEDECLVFEDWCEELCLHPLELMGCSDPEELWVLSLHRHGFGYGFGYGFGDSYGDGYGDGGGWGDGYGDGGGNGNGNGNGFGSGTNVSLNGKGARWATR